MYRLSTAETPEAQGHISECNSGKVIGTQLRSGEMTTTTKTFIHHPRHCLVLEETGIVSMTLDVKKRTKSPCLDERFSALKKVLPPLRFGSLLVPINDGLV